MPALFAVLVGVDRPEGRAFGDRAVRLETYTWSSGTNPNTASTQVLLACRIALRYAKRGPTHHDLMRDFGMSKATAFRWVNSIREARLLEGLAGSQQGVR